MPWVLGNVRCTGVLPSTFIKDEAISTLRLVLQLTLINERAPRLWWDGIILRFKPLTRCPLCNTGLWTLRHILFWTARCWLATDPWRWPG